MLPDDVVGAQEEDLLLEASLDLAVEFRAPVLKTRLLAVEDGGFQSLNEVIGGRFIFRTALIFLSDPSGPQPV